MLTDINSNNPALLHNVVVMLDAAYNWGSGFSDYNNIYVNSSNPQQRLGGLGTSINPSTVIPDLPSWNSTFTPVQDVNSLGVAPVFQSAVNLHLNVNSNPLIENAGILIAGVANDFDDEVRAANPGIGADELTPPTFTFYADMDGDGYGNPSAFVIAYTLPSGYVSNHDDCDDANASINPGAAEICNSIDDDCDGLIDNDDPDITGQHVWFFDGDGDGYGTSAISVNSCSQPMNFVNNNYDCNDTNSIVNPAAVEICNGLDDDCDGLTDSDDPSVTGQTVWYLDNDGDGYGNLAHSIIKCNQLPGYVANHDDCNDNNYGIHPFATEVCGNGIDDDCDVQIDEGCCIVSVAANSINATSSGICSGASVTLSVNGGSLGTNVSWKWYSGSCGGTYIGSGSSIIVSPLITTNYFVRAEGQCGTTSCKHKTITVVSNQPLATPVISGNVYGMCGITNAVFSVAAISGATNSTWTVPSGATIANGQGTTSISVNFGTNFSTNGNITVYASNVCVSSASASKTVFARLSKPVISGLNYACQNQAGLSYSCTAVTGANSYQWTVPAGSVIAIGQGTTSIVVNWGSINGVITVTAKKTVSSCASSLAASFGVSFTCKRGSAFLSDINNDFYFYPNPVAEQLILRLSGKPAAIRKVKIDNLLGEVVFEKSLESDSHLNEIKIDVANFKPGIYFLKVESTDKVFCEKFVKL